MRHEQLVKRQNNALACHAPILLLLYLYCLSILNEPGDQTTKAVAGMHRAAFFWANVCALLHVSRS